MTIHRSVIDLIGNTPLLRLNAVSDATGCEILGKCEFLNPGQSVKDRPALGIVRDAEAAGLLKPGGTIVEGTAGNTGIGLALVGAALGYRVVIVMPRSQSQEKKDAIRLLGAELIEVDAVPYANPNNYIKYSGRLAEDLAKSEPNGAIWANQFDNTSNRKAHYDTTGQEIWNQTDGKLDAFICAVGSGGTLGGVSMALKEKRKSVQIGLADPGGAAMYEYFKNGELKSEGTSITEGIGQGRVTANLRPGPERRPVPRRISRDQCCRRGQDGARHGAGTHDRDGAVRLWQSLSIEIVQSGIPEIEGPAGAAVDGEIRRWNRVTRSSVQTG